MPNPKRILIYGVTGSGKTTFAMQLSEQTGIPWHEVDQLTFEPGWVEVPLEEQRARIEAICLQPEWILDSAYGKWIDIPLRHVDLVIGLDLPRFVSFGRLLKRCVQRVLDQEYVCNGNVETVRGLFSRKSLILWHLQSFSRKRQRMRGLRASGQPPTLLLGSAKQVKSFLESCQQAGIESAVAQKLNAAE